MSDEITDDLIDIYVENIRFSNSVMLLFIERMERNDQILRNLLSTHGDVSVRRSRNTRRTELPRRNVQTQNRETSQRNTQNHRHIFSTPSHAHGRNNNNRYYFGNNSNNSLNFQRPRNNPYNSNIHSQRSSLSSIYNNYIDNTENTPIRHIIPTRDNTETNTEPINTEPTNSEPINTEPINTEPINENNSQNNSQPSNVFENIVNTSQSTQFPFPRMNTIQSPRERIFTRNLSNFYENNNEIRNRTESLRMPFTESSLFGDFDSNRFTFNFDILNNPEVATEFLRPVPVIPTQSQIRNATEIIPFSSIQNPSNNRCPISLIQFESDDIVTRIRYCGHIYSGEDLNIWFGQNVRCPLCRYDIRNYTRDTLDSPNFDPNIETNIETNTQPNIETNNDIESGTQTNTPTQFNLNNNESVISNNHVNNNTNISYNIPNERTVNMTQTTTINTETGEVTTNNETENINNLINITDGMSSLVNSLTNIYDNEGITFDTNNENNNNDAVNLIGSIVSRQINSLRPIIERTNATIDNINVEVIRPTNHSQSIIPRDISTTPFPVEQFSMGSLNHNSPISPLNNNDNIQNNIFSNISIDDFTQQTEEQDDDTDIDNEEIELQSTNYNIQESDDEDSDSEESI